MTMLFVLRILPIALLLMMLGSSMAFVPPLCFGERSSHPCIMSRTTSIMNAELDKFDLELRLKLIEGRNTVLQESLCQALDAIENMEERLAHVEEGSHAEVIVQAEEEEETGNDIAVGDGNDSQTLLPTLEPRVAAMEMASDCIALSITEGLAKVNGRLDKQEKKLLDAMDTLATLKGTVANELASVQRSMDTKLAKMQTELWEHKSATRTESSNCNAATCDFQATMLTKLSKIQVELLDHKRMTRTEMTDLEIAIMKLEGKVNNAIFIGMFLIICRVLVVMELIK